LVQDAAYGTLLREPRRALHARIAEVVESEFGDFADAQPETLARHWTEAGVIAKAAGLWGKAGQRSLQRSALVEAAAQIDRALDQIRALPASPALRHEEIKLQVALIAPLLHIKGYAAPETRAAVERAHLLIEQADALGEPIEDPLLLFSVLYSIWLASFVAANGDAHRQLAAQFLGFAEKQKAAVPIMIGHRIMGNSFLLTGDIQKARVQLDHALTLYDPQKHRVLATRFAQDPMVANLSWRSLALWLLGYPDAARRDTDHALKDAHEIAHAATLMYALWAASLPRIFCGDITAANTLVDELIALADEKDARYWKAFGMAGQGCVLTAAGKASDAIQIMNVGIDAMRPTGASLFMAWHLSQLAKAHATIAQFDEAWHCIGEAMTAVEATRETWCEAEVYRIAGEIALIPPETDVVKAKAYFERALAIARAQQAKSWELRAATSMARLWRGQGKRQEAQDILTPVYGWFTEGFDTLDLREAKALLIELRK
jgi:predicted ATPase